MYWYTVRFWKHALPKSMSLISPVSSDLIRMFSGFRSQWITFAPRSTLRDPSSCLRNTLTNDMERPLKLFWRSSSYRLMFSTSKHMHRCDRCTKWSIMRTMCRSSL
jgi:hypothetical protein